MRNTGPGQLVDGDLVKPGPDAGVVKAADINDGFVLGYVSEAKVDPGVAGSVALVR
jgi:hypothetical protein